MAARELTTGLTQAVQVKPTYGLGEDEIEAMLIDGIEHAEADVTARFIREWRVEAERILAALASALELDADLLTAEDRTALEAGTASLEVAARGTDHRALKAAVEALNRLSEPFAGRRMDRSVSRALAGRRLDEVAAK